MPPRNRYTPQVGTPRAGTPPWAGTPPRQVHPPGQVHPSGRYTPGQVHPPGQVPPGQVHPPGRYTPPVDGYCCGRYASYWNEVKVMFLHLSVSHSVHRGEDLGRCPPPGTGTPPGQVHRPVDGYCWGRYASYRNAFLFTIFVNICWYSNELV